MDLGVIDTMKRHYRRELPGLPLNDEDNVMVEFWDKNEYKGISIFGRKGAELNFTPKCHAIVKENIHSLEMDDAYSPFCGFQEEGDNQFLIERESQFNEVEEENITQWLKHVEIPGHDIHIEDDIATGYNWFR